MKSTLFFLKRPRSYVWSSQLQNRYLFYCHRTEHPLLDGYNWSCRNLHSKKSITRKPTFGSSHSKLIWKKMFLQSRENSWKMPPKRPTVQQSCRLEVGSCPKNEPSHSHLPRTLIWSWVIIYEYFKNLRTPFFPRIFSMAALIYYSFLVPVMLSLQTLTKYNHSGTAYCDSSLRLRLNNFICK